MKTEVKNGVKNIQDAAYNGNVRYTKWALSHIGLKDEVSKAAGIPG